MEPIALQLLPFTVEQFYSVFVQYNDSVWPMQIVLYVLGIAILLLRGRPSTQYLKWVGQDCTIGVGLAMIHPRDDS
jgi:hypothetical protein